MRAVDIGPDLTILVDEIHTRNAEDLERPDAKDGMTPFLLACSLGKLNVATYLSTQGIRIARRPVTLLNKTTALMLAARNGHGTAQATET